MLVLCPMNAHGQSPYSRIDSYALATPVQPEQDIQTLAAYLSAGAQTDLEKARCIYRWETDRISYNAQAFLAGIQSDGSPESTLRARTAVCDGYAKLYAALGQAAGLNVTVVPGFCKGYGFDALHARPEAANHAWNAIWLDGRWQLIDPTWGAGYIDPSGHFVKRYSEHFFLTSPEEFICDHFPLDPANQLLPQALSRQQFLDKAEVMPAFYHYGLHLESHAQAVIQANQSVTVTLSGPPDLDFMGVLERDGQKPSYPCTLVTKRDRLYTIEARFPREGRYDLKLYARRHQEGQVGDLDCVACYRIEAGQAMADFDSYPITFDNYVTREAQLIQPRTAHLIAGHQQTFRLEVPGALAVRIENDGSPGVELARSGNVFAGNVWLRPGRASIYARFGSSESYLGLAQLTVVQ